MFKINENNMKILRSTRKEVANFETMKQNFYAQKENFNEQEKIDLVFEFQAWMSQEIIEAQKRVSGTNSFTFEGKKMANEAGHIASLTNQLKAILIDIRTATPSIKMTMGYPLCADALTVDWYGLRLKDVREKQLVET